MLNGGDVTSGGNAGIPGFAGGEPFCCDGGGGEEELLWGERTAAMMKV